MCVCVWVGDVVTDARVWVWVGAFTCFYGWRALTRRRQAVAVVVVVPPPTTMAGQFNYYPPPGQFNYYPPPGQFNYYPPPPVLTQQVYAAQPQQYAHYPHGPPTHYQQLPQVERVNAPGCVVRF